MQLPELTDAGLSNLMRSQANLAVQARDNLAAVLALNNLSPYGLVLQVNGQSVISVNQAAAPPRIGFTIPMGSLIKDDSHILLNRLRVVIYNDDMSQELHRSMSIIPLDPLAQVSVIDDGMNGINPVRTVKLGWTPTAREWASVVLARGMKRIVIEGISKTSLPTVDVSGEYWSVSLRFEVT
ncbi:MAG: hypothetical protein K2X38_22000 [Gemmataceae bacterium]|nr:hypothetical protein [Gemmataceae bacterium]